MSLTLHTTLGDLKIELFCEQCPKTCEVNSHLQYTFITRLHQFLPTNITI